MLEPDIIVLDGLDTQTELTALGGAVKAGRLAADVYTGLLLTLFHLVRDGYAAERHLWIDTYRQDVKVFTGRSREPQPGPPRIWAAVSVGAGAALPVLLKSSDGYVGEPQDYWARLADAIARGDRGKVESWKP